MGGIFSKPKVVKAPPVQPPPAIPDVGEEPSEFARRKAPRGRRETFLTGDLIPSQDIELLRAGKKKKKVLG